MAQAYGWTPRQVERELTDEQLVLYLDSAVDRLQEMAKIEFQNAVEAVRVGTVFARDQKQYERWKRSPGAVGGGRARGLVGEALEVVVKTLAMQHPEYVAFGPRPVEG